MTMYCISKDGDIYEGDYVTRLKALADVPKGMEYHLAEKVKLSLDDVVAIGLVDAVLEEISYVARVKAGEAADNYLEGITDSQKKELCELVKVWFAKHNLQPTFYGVRNVEIINFKEEANEDNTEE